jgi:hypothetical protein
METLVAQERFVQLFLSRLDALLKLQRITLHTRSCAAGPRIIRAHVDPVVGQRQPAPAEAASHPRLQAPRAVALRHLGVCAHSARIVAFEFLQRDRVAFPNAPFISESHESRVYALRRRSMLRQSSAEFAQLLPR